MKGTEGQSYHAEVRGQGVSQAWEPGALRSAADLYQHNRWTIRGKGGDLGAGGSTYLPRKSNSLGEMKDMQRWQRVLCMATTSSVFHRSSIRMRVLQCGANVFVSISGFFRRQNWETVWSVLETGDWNRDTRPEPQAQCADHWIAVRMVA